MKLLFITDTHGKASSPKSRLDDYPRTVLSKMTYVGEYAKEIGASGIIHGGDWYDTPDVSEAFIREMSKVISGYPCPVYGVIGNHDIYGYNPSTFLRTGFGIAEGLGVFKRLYQNEPHILERDGEAVCLTGTDSYFDLDKNGKIDDYTDTPSMTNCVNIHVVHGMLVEREWPQVPCTTLEQVMNAGPNADIILTGHEHVGFGVKTFFREDANSKVIFANPGSLLRVTAGTGDVRRDVQMCVITITGMDYTVDLVKLPSSVAKPASEVLDTERLAQEKLNKRQLEGFISEVNGIEIKNSFNVFESLSELSKTEATDQSVIDECRRQLEIAQEELGINEQE